MIFCLKTLLSNFGPVYLKSDKYIINSLYKTEIRYKCPKVGHFFEFLATVFNFNSSTIQMFVPLSIKTFSDSVTSKEF